jgi:uncharacterized membrane protein (DUF485 family)
MTRVPVDHEKNLHIVNNPKYAELTKKRNAFSITLSVITLLIYFGFIFVIAYDKAVLSEPLSDGTVITVGLPVGVIIILAAFLLTGIYVRRANSEFDDLNHDIIKEAHE